MPDIAILCKISGDRPQLYARQCQNSKSKSGSKPPSKKHPATDFTDEATAKKTLYREEAKVAKKKLKA